MIKITITENEEKQRLDRFLKKYLRNAPLSYIYKLVRKNVKINGKRASEEQMLSKGDEVTLYISEEEANRYLAETKKTSSKRQFCIAFEDQHVIAVEKPAGLLTHGAKDEKENTLANQVVGYLIEKGDYKASKAGTFTPAPVNRLDRNTSGLVLFGKDYPALKALSQMLREREYIKKYYLTITAGEMKRELHLTDRMEKNKEKNIVKVLEGEGDFGKSMETQARPLAWTNGYTLVEVELVTGRTHQIRAHLAKAGYPVIGDDKYGSASVNRKVKEAFGLTAQFLHAYRLYIADALPPIEDLAGKEILSQLPPDLARIKDRLFGEGIKH